MYNNDKDTTSVLKELLEERSKHEVEFLEYWENSFGSIHPNWKNSDISHNIKFHAFNAYIAGIKKGKENEE